MKPQFLILISFLVCGLLAVPNFALAQCNGSETVSPGENTAVFSFSGVDNGYANVSYYPTNQGPGSTQTAGGNGDMALGLTGLQPCTEYTYTVDYSCKDGSSTGGGTFETSCGNCPPPFGLALTIGDDSVAFDWQGSFSSTATIDIVVSEVGGASGGSTTTSGNSGSVTGLLPCTNYTYTITPDCGINGVSLGSVGQFTTTGNCGGGNGGGTDCRRIEVRDIEITEGTNALGNTATFSWPDVGASTVTFSYQQVGGSISGSVSPSVNFVTFNALPSCNDFTYTLEVVCPSGSTYVTGPLPYRTPGCGGCGAFTASEISVDAGYDEATVTWPPATGDVDYYIVGLLKVGELENEAIVPFGTNSLVLTGLVPCQTDYYADVIVVCKDGSETFVGPLNFSTTCGQCGTVDAATISANPGATTADISWTAASGDVDYYVVNYYRLGGPNQRDTVRNGSSSSLSGLLDCTEYFVSVTSVCKDSSTNTSNLSNFFTTCGGSCGSLSASDISPNPQSNSIDLSWNAASGNVAYYVVNYNRIAQPTQRDSVFSGTSTTLSGLTSCSEYFVTITVVCQDNSSSTSDGVIVNTTGCSSGCDAPDVADIGILTGDSVVSIFFPSTGGSNKVILKKNGVKIAQVNLGTGTNYQFYNLEPCCSTYTVKVRTVCQNGTFNSGSKSFSTLCNSNKAALAPATQSVQVYPNPAQDQLNLAVNPEVATVVTGELFDLQGRAVRPLWKNHHLQPGRSVLNIDVADLPRGLYFLRLVTGDQQIVHRVQLQ